MERFSQIYCKDTAAREDRFRNRLNQWLYNELNNYELANAITVKLGLSITIQPRLTTYSPYNYQICKKYAALRCSKNQRFMLQPSEL